MPSAAVVGTPCGPPTGRASRASSSSAVGSWLDAVECWQRAAWRTAQPDRNANGVVSVYRRRFQLVGPAITPPGLAKTDFEIITTISKPMGHDMGWRSPAECMDEIAALTPEYGGVSHERIGRSGLQWPVAADGTAAPTLYEHEFSRPGGRARFAALPYKPPGDQADDEFPLVLIAGRRLQHYNAGTMTRRTANLDLLRNETLENHPADAARLWIETGDTVSVRRRVGRIETIAQVTDRIEPGHVFTAFHFPRCARTCSSAPPPTSTPAAPSTRSSPSTSGPYPKPRHAPRRSPRTSP